MKFDNSTNIRRIKGAVKVHVSSMEPIYRAMLSAAVLAIIALWISYISKSLWLQSVLENVGSGFVSSVVVIFLYDRIIENQEKKAKRERNRSASERLIVPLRGYFYGSLFPMYRSTVPALPVEKIEDWRRVLNDLLPDQLPHLDLSKASPGSYPEVTPYPKFISDGACAFSNALKAWLDKYGSLPDGAVIEAVERVIGNNFLILCCGLEQTLLFQLPPPFPAPSVWTSRFIFDQRQCGEFGADLSALVDAIERNVGRPVSAFEQIYWHNACYPIGYARRSP